jgi:hypothetical protein
MLTQELTWQSPLAGHHVLRCRTSTSQEDSVTLHHGCFSDYSNYIEARQGTFIHTIWSYFSLLYVGNCKQVVLVIKFPPQKKWTTQTTTLASA